MIFPCFLFLSLHIWGDFALVAYAWLCWTFFLHGFFNSLLSWFALLSCSIKVCHTFTVTGVTDVIVCENVGIVVGKRVGPAQLVCPDNWSLLT